MNIMSFNSHIIVFSGKLCTGVSFIPHIRIFLKPKTLSFYAIATDPDLLTSISATYLACHFFFSAGFDVFNSFTYITIILFTKHLIVAIKRNKIYRYRFDSHDNAILCFRLMKSLYIGLLCQNLFLPK